MVSTAFLFADDSIPECAAPADVGGYVFYLPRFHKVFANAAGTYVEHETGADPHYDSTGVTRMHSKRMAGGPTGTGLLGPTAGSEQEYGGLAVGPCWQLNSSDSSAEAPRRTEGPLAGFECLGDKLATDVYAVTMLPGNVNNASFVQYDVTYVLLDDGVAAKQTVTITDGRVQIDHSVVKPQAAGAVGVSPIVGFGVSIPLLAFDGNQNTTIAVGPDGQGGGSAVVSAPGMGRVSFQVPGVGSGHTIDMITNNSAPELVHSRNGLLQAVLAKVSPVETAEPMLSTVTTFEGA